MNASHSSSKLFAWDAYTAPIRASNTCADNKVYWDLFLLQYLYNTNMGQTPCCAAAIRTRAIFGFIGTTIVSGEGVKALQEKRERATNKKTVFIPFTAIINLTVIPNSLKVNGYFLSFSLHLWNGRK